MNLAIAIFLIALAFTILLSLPRREGRDHEKQKRYRENWSWPPR